MTERPILFSGPMVQAILAGRKAQTRRVVKPQPMGSLVWDGGWRDDRWYERDGADVDAAGIVTCPYGRPGDRLWVRETWRTAKSLDSLSPTEIAKKAMDAGWKEPWAPIRYEIDGSRVNWDLLWGEAGKTRVSIHMPRWASRLTLEVTEVRVQRLQEISEEDARAEGVQAAPFCKAGRPNGMEHVEAFEDLWQKINGKRPGCSWKANPWAWAISFKVLP